VDRILGVLNESTTVTEMDLPVNRFHRLTGQLRGFYSVSVSENWRIIFRFEDGNAFDVDYVDYH
jgi:proteic killer suppression protein